MTLGTKTLLFYPPVYPKINTEVNAVVSHINNPADFYIQLVLIIHINEHICTLFQGCDEISCHKVNIYIQKLMHERRLGLLTFLNTDTEHTGRQGNQA